MMREGVIMGESVIMRESVIMKESVIMRESVMMRECDDEGCVRVLAAEEERRVQERAAGCLERAPG